MKLSSNECHWIFDIVVNVIVNIGAANGLVPPGSKLLSEWTQFYVAIKHY